MRTVGSLWLAVVLLMLLLVAMASATAYESIHGTQQALTVFYKSWWFELLLVLLGVNVLAAMMARFPFTRRQIGFAVTHTAILVILIGAWITKQWGIDGQVSIVEGQTASAFQVSQECLTVQQGSERGRASLDLDPSLAGALHAVDLPQSPVLTCGGVQARIVRYLPDSQESTQVLDDNPEQRTAVEVVITTSDQEMIRWVFADEKPEEAGEVAIKLRLVDDRGALVRWLAERAASQPASKGTVKIVCKGQSYEVPLERCTTQPAAVGSTGYQVKVLRYLPHAVVGKDHEIENASSQPVNPAIEAEIIGPNGPSRRLAFARFPDFQSMHGSQPDQDLKLFFVTSAQAAVPIEIVAARSGELGVRFSPEEGKATTTELTAGKSVKTPWPGVTFAIRQRFDHARSEQTAVPIEPAREEATPAILVAVTIQGRERNLWLRKGDVRSLAADGATYQFTFADKSSPLGFNLTLDRFRIGRYPGTERPRSFESQVTFFDPAAGRQQSQVMSMNRPATHGGYTFYQSSYHQGPGGKYTSVLSLSWDPGEPIVFIGYLSMLAGMIWVVALRVIDRRKGKLPDSGVRTPEGEP